MFGWLSQVAVSLRHAALVTHRGEMYTWGQGSGGKLGLGNHQNADSPQRVYTLWGKSVKRVSCGGKPFTLPLCLAGSVVTEHCGFWFLLLYRG